MPVFLGVAVLLRFNLAVKWKIRMTSNELGLAEEQRDVGTAVAIERKRKEMSETTVLACFMEVGNPSHPMYRICILNYTYCFIFFQILSVNHTIPSYYT